MPSPGEERRRTRIASWPLIDGAGAVLAPAHVDDRDVEVADVADQVERLLAAGRLVHLEVVCEHLAHSEPDQRVIVDHKAVVGARSGLLPITRLRVRRRLLGCDPIASDPSPGREGAVERAL